MRAPVIAIAIAALLCAASSALAARRDYVGSATCGTCHPQVLAAWKTTAHARSTAALLAGGRAAKPPARCMACHGTGDAPAGRAYFAEVGCEACHGPGTPYATDDLMRDRPLALALGLVDLTVPATRTAVCARCHSGLSTRLKAIDLTKPVHPRPTAPGS